MADDLRNDPTRYRPIFPDSPFIHIADLVNPKSGKTYREENAEKTHAIPIGALVEIKSSGARLFVVGHRRDCDQTPLYSLSPIHPKDAPYEVRFEDLQTHGYSEDGLTVIMEAGRSLDDEEGA